MKCDASRTGGAATQFYHLQTPRQPPTRHPLSQPQAAAEAADDGDDPRSSSQFLTHLKKKTEANSEFSRTKTITQQRRSLPVYQIRDELMQVGPRARGGGEQGGLEG